MKKKVFWSIFISFALIFGILGVGYYIYQDVINPTTFSRGVEINGVDVSGLNKNQAQNVVSTKLIDKRKDIEITLKHNDKVWVFKGEDFEIDNQISPYVESVFNYFNSGNIFARKEKLTKLGGEKIFNISYAKVLGGLDTKIESVASEIDTQSQNSEVIFDATKKNPLSFTEEKIGEVLDKELLKQQIDTLLQTNLKIEIEVPVITEQPNITKEYNEKTYGKRGEFSTSYASSNQDRKFNIKHALESFNGKMIMPNEEVSFNQTTGSRTKENGYKKANIILNGVYIEGTGGGVCQASTTLYNALLNADLEILEVHKHTLPSSYIWLAFDAMVSEGYSDLRFKNNTEHNIYIKTYTDDKNAYVEVYGEKFAENERVERRVEFLGAIPHPGDRIVQDTKGEYSDKVTYKGEYYRLKYPREGYRAKAYLDRYVDGELKESKLLRDETYEPQEGIIIEGVEEVTEGITLPPNTVKFIQPQDESKAKADNVQKKLEKENPSGYNP